MGFALWVDEDTAWCAGTHEYRPMGVAVIAASQMFASRDFDGGRRTPSRRLKHFRGLFGSLVDVNDYMKAIRKQNGIQKPGRGSSRVLAIT
jgi:hypothetical protein